MTTARPGPGVLVIGVGNAYRSDDAIGLVLAQQVRAVAPEHVTVVEAPRDGMALLDLWQGAEAVILLDAICSGAAPGTLHRLEVGTEPLPAGVLPASTHALGVAEAIELARALQQLPLSLVVYGIEGQMFAIGEELSPAVARQIQAGVQAVLSEIGTVKREIGDA